MSDGLSQLALVLLAGVAGFLIAAWRDVPLRSRAGCHTAIDYGIVAAVFMGALILAGSQ